MRHFLKGPPCLCGLPGASVSSTDPEGSWWPKRGQVGGSALSLSALPSSASSHLLFPSLLQKLGPLGKRASWSGLGRSGHPSKSRSPHLGHVRLGLDSPGPGPVGTSPGQEGASQASPQGLCTSHSSAGCLPSAFLSLLASKSLSRGHLLSEATLTILGEMAAPTPDPSLGN